jgi:hypothetical protein
MDRKSAQNLDMKRHPYDQAPNGGQSLERSQKRANVALTREDPQARQGFRSL